MKETVEIYAINSEVWAISLYHSSDGCENHLAIFKAKVKNAYIEKNEFDNIIVEYMLTTPSGVEWGDTVMGGYVSDNFDDLILVAKKIWDKPSPFN